MLAFLAPSRRIFHKSSCTDARLAASRDALGSPTAPCLGAVERVGANVVAAVVAVVVVVVVVAVARVGNGFSVAARARAAGAVV